MNLPNTPPEHAIEAMLFASPTPIPAEELAEAGGWSKREGEDYVERLRRQLKDRSLEVRKVAGAYSLLTKSEVAPFVERILQPRPRYEGSVILLLVEIYPGKTSNHKIQVTIAIKVHQLWRSSKSSF